jgi:hypothetical protein
VSVTLGVLALSLLGVAYACIVVAIVVHSRGRGEEDDGSDGGGGTRPLRPDPSPPGPPAGADPEWWPSFEREFAAYVSARHSTSQR